MVRTIPSASHISRTSGPEGLRCSKSAVHSNTLLGLALLVLPAAAVFAQEVKSSFADLLEVRVVNVDAYVTDRAGEPVTGLTPLDFDLFEDKKTRLKITHFAAAGAASVEDPVTLVIYVDNENLRAEGRDRALATMQPELQTALGEGAKAMVVVHGPQLEIVQPLTDDPALIDRAFERLRQSPASDAAFETRQRAAEATVSEALRQFGGSAGDRRIAMATIDALVSEMQTHAQNERQDLDRNLDALEAMVTSLAGVPGRKALVYLSEGLPMHPLDSAVETLHSRLGAGPNATNADDLMEHDPGASGLSNGNLRDGVSRDTAMPERDSTMEVNRLQQAVGPYDATDRFLELTGIANTHRVTLFPIKAPAGDASAADARVVGRGSPEISDRREGLEYLATATAGLASSSGVDASGFIATARRSTVAHYSLGFEPGKKKEGAYTPLRLEVKRRGLQVRYRAGYFTRGFDTRLADRLLAVVTVGLSENELGLEADVHWQERQDDGSYKVQLRVMFPIRALTLVENNGVHEASARVVATALDARGRLLPVKHMDVPLRVPAAELAGALEQFFGAVVELDLPAGEQTVAVGLWDRAAGRGAFIRAPVEIGAGS